MAFLRSILNAWRRWSLGRPNVRIGSGTVVGHGVVARPGGGRITIGASGALETGVVLETYGGHIDLAARVFLGPYTVIYGHGGVTIGENTLVAMHCRILSSNHAVAPLGTDIRSQPDELRPTTIGRDVWLGAGVTVLGGVTIGDGCIIGAGAVVTKDLPSGAIATGVPAKVSEYRTGSPRPA